MPAKRKINKGDVFKLKDLGEVEVAAVDAYHVCVKAATGSRRHLTHDELAALATSGSGEK